MENRCFLCGRNGASDRLERHHIFGGSNRKKSEKYGLVVYLCGERCHRNGHGAVHRNAEAARKLKRYGQLTAMRDNRWTIEEFVRVFGKNYLEDEDG